jgi:hypothetical protein
MLFKDLTPIEEADFRRYARENGPENMEHWEIYHPVCRDEWMKRGICPPGSMAHVCEEAATILEALVPQHTRTEMPSLLRSVAKHLEAELVPS